MYSAQYAVVYMHRALATGGILVVLYNNYISNNISSSKLLLLLIMSGFSPRIFVVVTALSSNVGKHGLPRLTRFQC